MHDSRRTRLVLGVLLIIAIALITLDFRDGGASPVRNAGADIFGPVERVTHDVTNPVASLFDSITGGPSAQSTIANLQRENAELRAELSSAQLSKTARQQLTQLLQMDAGGYQIVAANVIAAGGDYSDTVTLDVGRSDGITLNETVLNGSGFVGTVTQVSEDTSTVLLADDASSVLGVQLAGSGQIGADHRDRQVHGRAGHAPADLVRREHGAAARAGGRHVRLGGRPARGARRARRHDRLGPAQRGLADPTALVQPFVNFTALGVVGVVVQVPEAQPEDLGPAAPRAHGHDHRYPQPGLVRSGRGSHAAFGHPVRRRGAAADAARADLHRGRRVRGHRPAHHRRPDRLPRRYRP